MRITFALPGLDGLSGGLRVAAQYAGYLQAQGHAVTLVARRPGPAKVSTRLAIKRFLGLARTPAFRSHGHFAGMGLPTVQLDDHRPVRPELVPDADIIVSTWWTTTKWVDRLPTDKGRHVHFIQGHDLDNLPMDDRPAIYDTKAHKVVVASWLADLLQSRYGQDAEVIPNGVDCAHFACSPRDRGSPPRIGFLHSSHWLKNATLAIAAAERMRQARPDLRGIAFGTKPRPADLPGWIDYEQQPPQDRIAQIYASCDLWLFTSVSEGFGLPILEAMASRTPVIATRAGAAPDLIDATNGRLADADAGSISAAGLALLDADPATWRETSDAALATATAHDLSRAAARFEAALVRIAAAAPAVGGRDTAAVRQQSRSQTLGRA